MTGCIARRYISLVLPVLTAGCLAGDAALKVTGIFVDQASSPYTDCTLTVTYRGKVIDQTRVSGRFEKTIVFGATAGEPLVVSGKCAGARGDYTTRITEMPKKFEDPVDFGVVVLEAAREKHQ